MSKIAVRLSMITFSSIEYYRSMQIEELYDLAEDVASEVKAVK